MTPAVLVAILALGISSITSVALVLLGQRYAQANLDRALEAQYRALEATYHHLREVERVGGKPLEVLRTELEMAKVEQAMKASRQEAAIKNGGGTRYTVDPHGG